MLFSQNFKASLSDEKKQSVSSTSIMKRFTIAKNTNITKPLPSNSCSLSSTNSILADETGEKLSRKEQRDLLRIQNETEVSLPTLLITQSIISAFSYEEMCKISSVEVKNPASEGLGSVNDPRMGPYRNDVSCAKCFRMDCPGHYGIINFKVPIINPLYIKDIISVLRCVCNSCGGLLLTEESLRNRGILRLRGDKRLAAIGSLIKDQGCKRKPESLQGGEVIKCIENPNFWPTKSAEHNQIYYRNKKRGKIEKEGILLPLNKVQTILHGISAKDRELMGFELGTSPEDFIFRAILVIPPVARPPVTVKGKTEPDALTQLYITIVKDNEDPRTNPETKSGKLISHIKRLINNSDGKAPGRGQNVISYQEKIQGKGGLVRNTMMGKRLNFCGRTVASPDPNLKFGQIRLPRWMRAFLRKREKVHQLNIAFLQKLCDEEETIKREVEDEEGNVQIEKIVINKGREISHVFNRNGTRRGLEHGIKYQLKIGESVERFLMEGDIVLVNRAPTLHKQGIMAMEVVFGKQNTIGSHLSYTTPYNLDFDGDEQGILSIYTEEADIEARRLMTPINCLMSAPQNRPIMGAVMNTLSGAYKLTSPSELMEYSMGGKGKNVYESYIDEKETDPKKRRKVRRKIVSSPRVDDMTFSSCLLILTQTEQIPSLYERLARYNVHPRSGHALFSIVLPEDFQYEHDDVVIVDGILIRGRIRSAQIGASHRSIIQEVLEQYGTDRVSQLLTDLPRVIDIWFDTYGLSVGPADYCITDPAFKAQNREQYAKVKLQVAAQGDKMEDPLYEEQREARIIDIVGNISGLGMSLAQKFMMGNSSENQPVKNSLAIMAKQIGGGAKSDPFNIAQITASLGQQRFQGQRIEPKLTGGSRTLPSYEEEDQSIESRGYVRSSFLSGLTPQEFFFHMYGGREGLLDTGTKTSEIGSLNHRVGKAAENIIVNADGTVRSGTQMIYQFCYGGDGFSSEQLMRMKDKSLGDLAFFIDVETICNYINIGNGWIPGKINDILNKSRNPQMSQEEKVKSEVLLNQTRTEAQSIGIDFKEDTTREQLLNLILEQSSYGGTYQVSQEIDFLRQRATELNIDFPPDADEETLIKLIKLTNSVTGNPQILSQFKARELQELKDTADSFGIKYPEKVTMLMLTRMIDNYKKEQKFEELKNTMTSIGLNYEQYVFEQDPLVLKIDSLSNYLYDAGIKKLGSYKKITSISQIKRKNREDRKDREEQKSQVQELSL